MADVLYLPAGFYAYSFQLEGIALPNGGAVTGCGENTLDQAPEQIAIKLATRFIANLLPSMTEEARLGSVYVRNGQAAGAGPSFVHETNNDGSLTFSASSPAIAMLCKWITSIGGRRGRGRWYLPGITEDRVDRAGVLPATTVASVTQNLQNFRAGMATDSCPIAVGHRYPAGFAGFKLAPTLITSGSCDGRVATQRKRQRR